MTKAGEHSTLGRRFNNLRYKRDGGRNPYWWPGRLDRKVKLQRDGETLKRQGSDELDSRRENNRRRRAADRAAIRNGLSDAEPQLGA